MLTVENRKRLHMITSIMLLVVLFTAVPTVRSTGGRIQLDT